MSIKFAKRAAAQILNRGETAIRLLPGSVMDVDKALTKDDVRRLIEKGSIYAVKAKHNASSRSKILKKARAAGRRRGIGRRRGTDKARQGRLWEKKVRSQRRLLKELKLAKKIDTAMFNQFYSHVKGNQYATKANLLLQLREHGVQITEDEVKAINEKVSKEFK